MKSAKSSNRNQADLEKMIEIMRAELRISFWQGATVALAIFILSLFVILILRR
jgi:hypothetical protein